MIRKVSIFKFRNFVRKSLKFSENTTVIVGPNASGKTNILEAIYLLSTGKSFRARVEEEMISYNREIARVNGLLDSSSGVIRMRHLSFHNRDLDHTFP